MDDKEFTLWGLAIIGVFVILMTLTALFHTRAMTCIQAGYTQEIVPTQYEKIWVKG